MLLERNVKLGMWKSKSSRLSYIYIYIYIYIHLYIIVSGYLVVKELLLKCSLPDINLLICA